MASPLIPNPYNHPVIVGLVGGTGGNMLMSALRPHAVWPIAVCTVCDNGGSTGNIRKAFPGIIGVGDIRNCAEALMNASFVGKLDQRIPPGDGDHELSKFFAEHHILNLMYLSHIENAKKAGKDQITAIAEMHNWLGLEGEVWPVSPTPAHLIGTFCDGSEEIGEELLDQRPRSDARRLRSVRLTNPIRISRQAREAILKADLIVLGPGDLFTSLIPNLLVGGVQEAIAESEAPIVFVMNLMSKQSETGAFTPMDFLEQIFKYGIGRDRFHRVLINNTPVPTDVKERYFTEEGAEPIVYGAFVETAEAEIMSRLMHRPWEDYTNGMLPLALLDETALQREGFVRHDRIKLAEALVQIANESIRRKRL